MLSDPEFLKKLLAAFRVEANEHIQAMSNGLLELENSSVAGTLLPIVETVFREAHSLKGAARAVELPEIESICQALESVFAAWKTGKFSPAAEQFDVMHQAVDMLSKLLASPDPGSLAGKLPDIVQSLEAVKKGAPVKSPRQAASSPTPEPESLGSPPSQSPEPQAAASAPAPVQTSPTPSPEKERHPAPLPERAVLPETIRIAASKLDALLLEAEDMVSIKLVAGQRATELSEAYSAFAKWRKAWTKFLADSTASGASLDVKSHEFLDWSQGYLQALENRFAVLARSTAQDRRSVGSAIDSLLENTKKLVMLPFSTLLEAFPKMVRDLARDEGKSVGLEMRGGDVEIDKRVLEEMKDPLVHLLRNSVDHGLEKPPQRLELGKPERGKIDLEVSQVDGSTVEILISDDGSGIDPETVKRSALKHGLLTEEDAARLDDQEAVSLIFRSGISTSPILTEVSGRGLGMAIVREKVEKIRGRVSVETHAGKGTTFRILLPLALSTFRGVLVEAAEQIFVFPVSSVERVTRIKKEDIHSVENRESITLDNEAVSFVRLSDALRLPPDRAANGENVEWIRILVIASSQERVAFGVNRVLDEQEVLVKPLGKPLVRVQNIAGATVLGSGKAVPILNVHDLLKSAGRATRAAEGPGAVSAKKDIRVLVVEDSITSRMLLKNILESAGYEVRMAVDGVDAWTTLRTEPCNLVVSDVEMPRMNGFDLTAKIRADKRLSELPVVLVTAREAREDRERGIDVGASAYVVKSSFDQSNLLEVIGRLI